MSERVKKKSRIWIIVLVVCLGVFIFAGYNIIPQLLTYKEAKNEYQSIADIAQNTSTLENGGSPAPDEDSCQIPIDFKALTAINPDIIGWINIPGTVVDYPLVQCGDNDIYLHTTFEGRRNSSGAIFADYRSASDFSDQNILIYGHNMKNGMMFAPLADYRKQSFYEEHPTFIIYTPDVEYQCEIFSAYVTATDTQTYTIDYPEPDSFSRYLDYVKGRSKIHTDVTVIATDNIVTLSTCDYQFEDARLVVHAKMVRK